MSHLTSQSFKPLQVTILTVSDTRTEANDTSGQLLYERALTAGHRVADRQLVKDDIYQIRSIVSQWIASEEIQAVLITGGTGFTPRDNTPEAIRPLLDKEANGFGELFREISARQIASSTIQSRALAGLANRTLIACMPGSTNACRTAWDEILVHQLDATYSPCNFVPHLKR